MFTFPLNYLFMKKILVQIFLCIIALNSYPQIVSPEKAGIVARNFFSERIWAAGGQTGFEFNAQAEVVYCNALPSLYIYKCINTAGYIIIAADYSVYPVFGYSFESSYEEAMATPVFQEMLKEFSDQVDHARTNKISPAKLIENEWKYYSTEQFNKNNKDLKTLLPILQTKWDQGCYYNDLCPPASQGPCGKVWAGCVATAMGQVMKFHNWPPQGQGNNIYLTPNGYGTLNANFGQTFYNWDQMLNSLTEFSNNFEVAQLLYHCGISVNMDYNWDGSGASTVKTATSLIDHFIYADYIIHQEKDYFDVDLWSEILCIELHSDRPVLYRGYGGGGHAFVCDGYQGTTNKMFHFNLGWGGAANGFYSLSNVAGFNQDQAGIFGVEPKYTGPQYCNNITHLTAPSGVITDGSAESRYANNSSCKWLIQPENAGAILLNFNYLKTEPGSDRIRIYEGDSENGWLIADISGFNVPSEPIVVNGGSMFVWFFSDEFNAAGGWEASYSIWATDCEEFQQPEARLTPNPASDKVEIQLNLPLNEDFNFQIHDVSGKLLISKPVAFQNGHATINLPDLSEGFYSVQLYRNSTPVLKEKLIIRH